MLLLYFSLDNVFRKNSFLTSCSCYPSFQYSGDLSSLIFFWISVECQNLNCYYFLFELNMLSIVILAIIEIPQVLLFLLLGTVLTESIATVQEAWRRIFLVKIYWPLLLEAIFKHWTLKTVVYRWQFRYFWSSLVPCMTSIWKPRPDKAIPVHYSWFKFMFTNSISLLFVMNQCSCNHCFHSNCRSYFLFCKCLPWVPLYRTLSGGCSFLCSRLFLSKIWIPI